MFGWRATLAVICFSFSLSSLFIRSIPEMRNASARLHSPREYLAVFKGRGSPVSFSPKPAVSFVFAAIGNLIPFRMAELGQGHSEGLIGLMYFGYSVGLVASLSLAPLMRVFKTPTRLILFASAVYVASCLTLAVPSLWALFGGLWLIAFGEFVVHSISPGLINHQAMLSGHGDRGMVNGLFFPVIISAGFSAPTSPELSIRGSAGLPATSVFNSSRLPRFSFCSDCTGRHLTAVERPARLAFRLRDVMPRPPSQSFGVPAGLLTCPGAWASPNRTAFCGNGASVLRKRRETMSSVYRIENEEGMGPLGRRGIELTHEIMYRHYRRDEDFVYAQMAEGVTWIGPSRAQYTTGVDKLRELLQIEQLVTFTMEQEPIRSPMRMSTPVSSSVAVMVTSDEETGLFIRTLQRVSFFYRLIGDRLHVVHMHLSHPYEVVDSDEVFPFRYGKDAFDYIQQTHQMAFTDSLTELGNRNAYETSCVRMAHDFDSVRSYASSCSISTA